jgi:two-component system, chemotaxis family, response regulator PixG
MKSQPLNNGNFFDKAHPITFLNQLAKVKADGCLEVIYGSLTYWIHFKQGNLIYATNSLQPFERLERHLRYFSTNIPTLNGDLRTQLRVKFEPDEEENNLGISDYQAVLWLVKNKYITNSQGFEIIEALSKEVLETYLLIPTVKSKSLIPVSSFNKMPTFCHFETSNFINHCLQKIEQWQSFHPHVWSSYQRPYFVGTASDKHKLTPEQKKKLASLLKGFNFRQLGAILHQDEISLIKRFYPLIVDGAILLRDPQPPFDQLPEITENSVIDKKIDIANNDPENEDLSISNLDSKYGETKIYKVACIDDSPIILREIERFLDDESLETFLINDSTKALISLIRIKPDLILLDVGMPSIDGYQICTMLRKHHSFKNTPIVMVTGNKGIINRAKAKLSGATDYLTKPFTQPQLLQIVFRYLS